MKTYIVFDLEWNQCPDGKDFSKAELPFEIVEIGAVKLDENFRPLAKFRRIIRPVVYKQIHFRISEVIHMGIEELRSQGEDFAVVAKDFLAFCFAPGERPVFCTWGNLDLTQLQQNMRYHRVDFSFSHPLLYYDVQKLYRLFRGMERGNCPPLERVVYDLGIPADREFHRALADAHYTGRVMASLDMEALREYVSVDYFHLPGNREEELYLVFPDYSKYVSRLFPERERLMEDKTVTDILCYRCRRMLKKRLKWFGSGTKIYYGLARCPEHGLVRGKIRVKTAPGGSFYAIKTTKIIGEDTAALLEGEWEESRNRRKEKNRRERARRRKTKSGTINGRSGPPGGCPEPAGPD